MGFDAIDGESRPLLRRNVFALDVDGQHHVIDEHTGKVTAINPRAALALPFFDGEVSLKELAADVADVFGLEPDVAVVNLVAIAQHLGHLGVLEGIAPVPTEWVTEPDEPVVDGAEPSASPASPAYLYVAPDT